MRCRSGRAIRIVVVAFGIAAAAPSGAQELETETTRLPPMGGFEVGTAVEWQFSGEGNEVAVPLELEYGILDWLALLVEPVAYAGFLPNEGTQANDIGDLEATLTGRFLGEGTWWPALALAAEVKFPTARNPLIGTGVFDYTFYFLASKRLGPIDLHFNFGYAIIGQPAGVVASNMFNFALAAVASVTSAFEFYGEALYATSFTEGPEGGDSPGGTPLASEIGGEELVGTVGAGCHFLPDLLVYLGVSYDSTGATQVRSGLTWYPRIEM